MLDNKPKIAIYTVLVEKDIEKWIVRWILDAPRNGHAEHTYRNKFTSKEEAVEFARKKKERFAKEATAYLYIEKVGGSGKYQQYL